MLTRNGLEELYARLEKPLYNVLFRWVWNREEALELTQETFLKLWTMRKDIRMETVEPLTYRIGCRLAANRCRSRRLWRMATLEALRYRPHEGVCAEELVKEKERRLAVQKAVMALPNRLRTVILLCEYSGMSTRDIASALEIPEGTVSSRRNTARARLHSMLSSFMED